MKYSLLLAVTTIAACLMPSIMAQQTMDAKAIEDNVRAQMSQMIANYDFQSAIDNAVQEELYRIQFEKNQQTIEELITKLSVAMKDQKHIIELWPDAPTDIDMFSNLQLNFDLHENQVTTETAAKDVYGTPYFKHVLNTAQDSSVAYTGKDVTSYRPPSTPQYTPDYSAPAIQQPSANTQPSGYDMAMATEYQKYANAYTGGQGAYTDQPMTQYQGGASTGASAGASAQNPWTTQPNYASAGYDWMKYLPENSGYNTAQGETDFSGYNLGDANIDDPRVLTIEEQREVAFKVVFFFIGLIIASFGVLYIYHRMTQANIKSVREKQTFFDFLAGQVDENAPVYANVGSRYQI